MKLYLPITVDLYNIYPLRVLNLQQNNVGRGALITLTAAGAVIVPESESLYVYAQKPDGTVVYNTCTLKDNQIQVDFDEQMTVESGILQVELQMVDTSGNSITTPIFQVNVQKSNIDYQKITSQDSFQALVTTLAEAQELKKTGLKGDPGEAATIQVGTVTASDPGADPAVTNSGTEQDAVLNFVLPRGIQGPAGPKGDTGTANAATVAYDNSTSGAAETNAQDAFDKLYGGIASLTEKIKKTHVSYYGLILAQNVTSTSNTDYELQKGRKFSDYKGLINVLFMPTGSNYLRPCGDIPTSQFINFKTVEFSFSNQNGAQWVDVMYVSDTKISVKASIPGKIWVNAIDTEILS